MAPSALAGTPLADLQKRAISSVPEKTSKPAKEWLDEASTYLAAAQAAERAGNREETFLNYSKALICYNNFVSHESSQAARREQRTQLMYSDFRSTYNHYVDKVQALKTELRDRPVEQAANRSESPAKTDTSSMGSIADRMAALRGRGMEAESSKRISRDMGSSQAPKSHRESALASTGSEYAGAKASASGQAHRQGQGEMLPPPLPSAPMTQPEASRMNGSSQPVKPTTTGSSYHSTRSRSSTQGESKSGEGSCKSSPPTPILTPHVTAGSAHSRPQSPPQSASSASFPNPHSPGASEHQMLPPQPKPKPQQYTSPPVVGQHHNNLYHRTSPSLPSFPNPPRNDDYQPSPRHETRNLPPTSQHPAKDEDDMASFASAFPSLSEFGKQFADPVFDPPSSASQRSHPVISEEDGASLVFPSVPSSIPGLPSAPKTAPGAKPNGTRALPEPPSKPLGDPPPRAQATDYDPAVQPRRMFLPDGRMDPAVEREERARFAQLGLSYTPLVANGSQGEASSPKLGESSDNARSPRSDGPSTLPSPSVPPLAFPTPQVARSAAEPLRPASSVPPRAKTQLPMSNAVEAAMLRHYLMDETLDVLLIDARSLEEFEAGYVGDESLRGQAGRNRTVWADPTVLFREGLTSDKLADALSLSLPEQQKAFNDRQKFDLVVFYDQSSASLPSKGQFPTAISVLFKILYENEYSKTLQRSPVLLTGGFRAWEKMLKDKEARRAQAGASSRPYNPKSMTNGTSYIASSRPPNVSSKPLEATTKRQNRDTTIYQQTPVYAKNLSDNLVGYSAQSMTGERSYSGHMASPPSRTHAASAPLRHPNGSSTSLSSYAPQSSYGSPTAVAPPPQASINPGPLSRRRSDYVEQHNQSYSGYSSPAPPTSRASLDYPQAHPLTKAIQPPPAAASHALERHEPRGHIPRSQSIMSMDAMSVLPNGEDMKYWNDVALGLSGLKNLGNTCYMNSTLQCLSATFPFARFFLDGRYKRSINMNNPLGTKGNLANAFAELITALWQESYAFLSPITFRKSITRYAPHFSGTDQHDSQEFLSFVLDGLHEDLNRIQHKPPPVEMTPEREAALETLPPEVASEKEWQIYKMRNDSLIVDLFQGQYRNRLECLTCHKTSTTYDAFMYLALPVPMGKSKVVLQQLIDEFVKVEIMEGPEAWNCPRCKVPRRTSKTLTISRLPPVLLIQLKRFSTQNGVFWDKSETPVIFPVKGLDLTRYLPASLPVAKSGHNGPELEDPRTQIGPFRYDLYGVSNHMGSLSSGHYTAFVNSSKGWQYCEDSKVTKAKEQDVVSRPAYLLFYKRVRA